MKRIRLGFTKFKLPIIFGCLVFIALVGVVLANSINRIENLNSGKTAYIQQNISKSENSNEKDFQLRIEQDEDTPFKIINAKSSLISRERYQELTSETTEFQELISVPEVNLQNVSDKVITGVTLIISDKAANTKRGFYIREQSIKPGQQFTIVPESLVPSEKMASENPKFWLNASDKSQVVVRVVAFFEDGSMWANTDQRY